MDEKERRKGRDKKRIKFRWKGELKKKNICEMKKTR